MSEITGFLLARIAEDEAAARQEDEDYAHTTLLPTYDSEHQSNWNTARVLAECAAKRAMVDIHRQGVDPCDAHDAAFESIPCDTVRALAAVYKDHADYKQGVGMSKGTPHRPIRISDDLWAKAQAKAAQEGTTASEVIRAALKAYVEPQMYVPQVYDCSCTEDCEHPYQAR